MFYLKNKDDIFLCTEYKFDKKVVSILLEYCDLQSYLSTNVEKKLADYPEIYNMVYHKQLKILNSFNLGFLVLDYIRYSKKK